MKETTLSGVELFKLEQEHKQAMHSRDRCNLTHMPSVGFWDVLKLFCTEIINKKFAPQSKPPIFFLQSIAH